MFCAPDGVFLRCWGSKGDGNVQFRSPTGVAVANGEVFVTDWGRCNVSVFRASDGAFLRKWGSEGSGEGHFKGPLGVAVDGGLVYVADSGNGRVQVFEACDGRFVRQWAVAGATGLAIGGGVLLVTGCEYVSCFH